MTRSHSTNRTFAWFAVGLAVLAIAVVGSLMIGAFSIGPRPLIRWMLGISSGSSDDLIDRVLWSIRLPRVLAAVAVGAALGAAGATLQGTFRTPLADPHLLGYSSAAGAGAAFGFALTAPGGFPILPVLLSALLGALFGVATVALRTRTGTDRFLLSGVAFGFALLAWTGMFVLIVDSPRVPTFLFFVFGSLAATTWKAVIAATILLLPAVFIMWHHARGLDLLSLGGAEARALGFDSRRSVPVIVGAVGVAIGASVVLGGVVGFVGLLIPFMLRPLIGPAHRTLIPASAIGGGVLVVVADTVARTVASPAEIPLGLITAALGGPFLGWLLLRRRPT